jgi:GMP synthase (glutamine-hydrolysing)
VPFEPLGTLDQQFRGAGFRIRYLNFHREPDARVDPRRYNGLVVLGGPMGADEIDRHPHLAFEQEAIRVAVDAGLPVLGICLGAQLIAASQGGKTLRGQAVEIGWHDVAPTASAAEDPLLRHFTGPEKLFQWHADTFELPAGAVHLARSAGCENQAFRIEETAYGLQFHLEADRKLIGRWLRTPHHLREIEQLAGSDRARATVEEMTRETERHMERAHALSRAVFGEFIERFYVTRGLRRRLRLPSR